MSDRPTAISLFAGAGGLCLGFEQAGFDVPVAVEVDPIHAATHALNFPMWETICAPVEAIQPIDIYLKQKPPIDVIIGGPPCQSFSRGGKRDPDDARSHLLGEFVRLVAQIYPKYFVLENVKGLTQGHCRKVLEQAIADLKTAGYHLPPWQVLNAKDYGVPQNRERLFLLGSRHDLPPVHYPAPTRTVTVQEALADIPDTESSYWSLGDGRVKNYSVVMGRWPYARKMQCLSEGAWMNGYPREWDSAVLYNSHATEHSQAVLDRFAQVAPGERDPISRFYRLDPKGVSPTLRAGTDSSRGKHTAPRPIHHLYDRCITVREMARLSGFPDWFRFDDRKWHGARQIGNAVPPPMAYAVAREVMNALKWRKIT